jgi:hypothetical protein
MSARRRLLHIAATLPVVLAIFAGCAASEDETGTMSKGVPTTASAGGMQAPSDNLDPVTKAKCLAVWNFAVSVYEAHTSPDASGADKDRMRKSVQDYGPVASNQVADLADAVKKLTAHSLEAVGAPNPTALPADVEAANQQVQKYLQTTCQFQS